ncbi:hypothetical protein GJ496_004681 [Pomphorhynchus laevis]|nr:hypothetical protein GJ496_004681 [Pomphorhynchus laevis]
MLFLESVSMKILMSRISSFKGITSFMISSKPFNRTSCSVQPSNFIVPYTKYENLVKDTLYELDLKISKEIESFPDLSIDADVELSNNDTILKVCIDGHHFVINRQSPSRQIWMSSPVSGPYHFNLNKFDGDFHWICMKSDKSVELESIVMEEVKTLLAKYK